MSASDNATISRFDQYAPPAEQSDYRAFGVDKLGDQQNGIRIYDQNGRLELISYAYLMRVICTSHQAVALILSDGAVMLSGENLTGLVELIQDRKVRSLHCYCPDQGNEPVSGEPLIKQIDRMSKDDAQAA